MLTGAVAAASCALGARSSAMAEDCQGLPGGDAVRLGVETTGLASASGEVAVTVYPDDPDRFLAPGGKLLRVRAKTTVPVNRACFWLPPGAYAVAVYHDANANHDFDRDALGRPVEGYGFSNDPPDDHGPPAFRSVRFRLPPGGATVRVKLRYLR